jgi:penicillin-binding protein-related factor A (putative recombinase)
MSARETSLWKWLAKARKSYKSKLLLVRVENKVSAGMSDVVGCCEGITFFIELKCVDCTDSGIFHIRFEPAQIEFMDDLNSAGGNYFVLLNVKRKGQKDTKILIQGWERVLLSKDIDINKLICTPGYVVKCPQAVIENIRESV